MVVHRRRRRKTADGGKRIPGGLTLFLGIVALSVFTRVAFPAFSRVLGDKIDSVVNYRAALAALGEGLSGDRKFGDAFSEAWSLAFKPSGGTADANAETGSGEESLPAFSDSGAEAPPSAEAPPPEDEPVSDAAAEFSDAVTSALLNSDDAWSGYGLPAGVSLSSPELSFEYTLPAYGTVTSPFGYREHPVDGGTKFHYGIDIAAAKGAAVYSFADGRVSATGESTTLGKYVMLKHDGVDTVYGHLSKITVKSGDSVKCGGKIGEVGSTGNATGNCLHFEIKIGGEYVNPAKYYGAAV